MAHELLNHPAVLKVVRIELLRGGYDAHQVDDGVRDVVIEVYEYLVKEAIAVETVDRMQAIVRVPAYRRGIDKLRSRYTEADAIAKVAEQMASQPPPPPVDERLDQQRALDHIAKNLEKHDAVIIEKMLDGETQKEIAEGIGISHDKARKETVAMRSRLRTGLRAAGYVGIVAGVLATGLLLFRTYIGQNRIAHPPVAPSATVQPPSPPPEGPVAAQGPTPEEQERAAALRATAHAAALKKDWRTCAESYDAAEGLVGKSLDPAQQVESNDCSTELAKSLVGKQR